jgi:hypothetical protein
VKEMHFKRSLVIVLVLILGLYRVAKGEWEEITGRCELEKEVVIKKGTKVRMLTRRDRKVVVEEVTLKSDRRGTLLNCETGTYAILDSCRNLVVISEKPQKEKIVIEREHVYEPIYIEKPVYVTPPPPVIYYAPPPPPSLIPHVHFFFHYEKHHYRFHPHYSRPDPPRVITHPPFLR